MLMITAIFASIAFTSSILLVFLCANWISTKRKPSLCYNYLMAVSIVICLQMVELIIVAFEFHHTFPVLVCIVDPVTISLPFLIFGFLATSEGKTAPNNFKQIWPHLIPSTLLLLSYIPVWLLSSKDKLEYITNFYFLEGNNLVNITPDPNQFLFIFGMLSLFYWWKLFQLQRNTRHSNHIVARLNRRIKLFMLILAFITIVLGISGHRYSTVMLLSFLASIFSAYCCYFFMLSSRVTFKGISNNTLKSTNYIPTNAILDSTVKSDTDSTVMNLVYSLLENKMNEKMYRDNDLSLKRVADACGVSTHLASQTINECFGSNFYNWVNTYRISEFKTLLAKDNTINITQTAYQVGFNSKSTFYSAFKKLEGITPTEFRKTLADS